MSVLFIPPCPTDCSGALADVSFNDCAPEWHWGEITKIYIAESNFAGFTDVTSLAEWTTNLSDTADDKIRTLIVKGELPEPETTETPASGDRIAIGYKTFSLPFIIDETNDINYNFLLLSECGGKYKIWYETSDGVLYGGNAGIEVSLRMNQIIPLERTALVTLSGKFTWKSLQSPFRSTSPMA